MDIKNVGIAYSAILSTYSAILASIIAWTQWKRRIRVTIGTAIIGTVAESIGAFVVTAANPGARPVSIHQASLELPNRKQLIIPGGTVYDTHRLRHNLEEGQSCSFYFPLPVVAKRLTEEGFSGRVAVRGLIRDGLGNPHRSKRLRGVVEDWARANLA